MDTVNLRDVLHALFEAHGVTLSPHDDWLVSGEGLPAIGAAWAPREPEQKNHRLDVSVILKDQSRIIESFGDTSQSGAIRNFVVNSFHVILAALWDQPDYQQINIEEWEINGSRWQAVIGNFGIKSASEDPVQTGIPSNFHDGIINALQKQPLKNDFHWARFYIGRIPGQPPIYEALLDNDAWPDGLDYLSSIPWYQSEAFYSIRNFLILKKLPHSSETGITAAYPTLKSATPEQKPSSFIRSFFKRLF